jgi:hypothetical protein
MALRTLVVNVACNGALSRLIFSEATLTLTPAAELPRREGNYAAEISAALTSLRAALDLTKAMIGLRDAEAFRTKSIELQGLILESLDKAIESHEAYSTQLDRIRALEAEVASLKDCRKAEL